MRCSTKSPIQNRQSKIQNDLAPSVSDILRRQGSSGTEEAPGGSGECCGNLRAVFLVGVDSNRGVRHREKGHALSGDRRILQVAENPPTRPGPSDRRPLTPWIRQPTRAAGTPCRHAAAGTYRSDCQLFQSNSVCRTHARRLPPEKTAKRWPPGWLSPSCAPYALVRHCWRWTLDCLKRVDCNRGSSSGSWRTDIISEKQNLRPPT
jgi:hypothetical protein